MLRRLNLKVVGVGQHRSGWPYCVDALQPLFTSNATVLLDDFIERTFMYDKRWNIDVAHKMPWVGIMHHPPDMPTWYMDNLRLQNLLSDQRWLQAVQNLKLIITLGENLQRWCQATWPKIPSVVIKHPTGMPMLYWSPERFLDSPKPRVVQVGWFLRNVTAIYQARVPSQFRKAHLIQNNEWSDQMQWLCREMYRQLHPERSNFGDVDVLQACDDTNYDILLASSVVLIEVISAVANNTVVECIARNTPICLNRHPGPVAYLGNDYPLFYDHFDDIERTLTMENILAAHKYLCAMDKWWIRGAMFREQVQAACLEHVPECRTAKVLSLREETCEI